MPPKNEPINYGGCFETVFWLLAIIIIGSLLFIIIDRTMGRIERLEKLHEPAQEVEISDEHIRTSKH